MSEINDAAVEAGARALYLDEAWAAGTSTTAAACTWDRHWAGIEALTIQHRRALAALSAALPHLTPESAASSSTAAALVALSRWVDAGNAGRDPEAVTWGRLAKLTEEAGEVVAAYIGATGQNPRKGVTHATDDVVEELLDVAVTALAAVEHLTLHDGSSMQRLAAKVERVAERAGLALPHLVPESASVGPWQHEGHRPMPHRDGKPPWCPSCGWSSPVPAMPAVHVAPELGSEGDR